MWIKVENSITLDDATRNAGNQYYDMFLNLSSYKMQVGDINGSTSCLNQMKELLPFERLQPTDEIKNKSKEIETFITNLNSK